MKKIETTVSTCDACPHGGSEKVYTADSFENVRKVHCALLKKDVHRYLDWNEAAIIPKDCPLEDVVQLGYTKEQMYQLVDTTIFSQICFGFGRIEVMEALRINFKDKASKEEMAEIQRIALEACNTRGVY